MFLKRELQLLLALTILLAAVVFGMKVDEYLAYPVITTAIILVVLCVLWAIVKLLPIHWLIRSAEWQLMEIVHRVATGTDSRTRKGEEKLKLFTQLAHETQQIYTGPAQAGGHRFVGDLPKAPFRQENLMLLNSQDSEMDKVSKRKAIVRLNAALLREVLYGTTAGYKSRVAKLTQAERETVMANIESLAKQNPAVVYWSGKLFRHPSSTIRWDAKGLKGRKALDFLTHF